KRRNSDPIRRRAANGILLGVSAEFYLRLLGQLQLLRKLAGRITEETRRKHFTSLAAPRVHCSGSRKRAHVQPVGKFRTATVGSLSHLDDVASILRREHGNKTILHKQGGVIGMGQHFAAALVN